MSDYSKIALVVTLSVFIMTVPLLGCPKGDITGDCRIDIDDLLVLSRQWLESFQPFTEEDGMVVMEAEHYADISRGAGLLEFHQWRPVSDDSASNGIYMAIEDLGNYADLDIAKYSPHLSYSVNFRDTGTYYLWVKAEGLNGNSDSLHFGLDGVVLTDSDNYMVLRTDGFFWRSWLSSIQRPVIQVDTAGIHSIDIWMREDGVMLDQLLLTTDEDYNPQFDNPVESPGYTNLTADLDDNSMVDQEDFSILARDWLKRESPLVISEFMASNDETLKTKVNGEVVYPDWIEIHNTTDNTTYDLGGMYLTDDMDDLQKWRIPEGVSIAPQGYVLFFASGSKDGDYPFKDDKGFYHTNFKLDADGEYLALVGKDGKVAYDYAPVYPPQRKDISYGIYEGNQRYFSQATPRADNQDPFIDFVADVQIDGPHGFYDGPVSASVSCPTEGAIIRYTLDGSDPTITHGVVINGASWESEGKIGGAIFLDGQNDFIEIPGYQGIAGGQSRSVCAWVKTNRIGQIISWGTKSPGQRWSFMIDSSGAPRVAVASGTIIGTTSVFDGQWHHVAAVMFNDGSPDVSEVRLYVDGQREEISESSAREINTALADNVKLGVFGGVQFFSGLLDDVRIYNRALSDVEVTHLAAISKPVENGLVSCWTLDEGQGDTAHDICGAHDGILVNSINITKTSVVRVAAFKEGWLPSDIQTRTYIIEANSKVKSLPVISLVGDAGKVFYEPDGIMAIVGGAYGGGGWYPLGPDDYNNPMQRGIEYERPVSAEWIVPQDNSGFQEDCGIRVHGSSWMRPRYRRADGYWSGDAKFSLRLYFRDRYGSKRLEYPLIPAGPIDRFKSIVLRAGHNDRTNPFIKDELHRRLYYDMGHASSIGTFANLFINGEYKGYYNPCHHITEAFCQEWYDSSYGWDVMDHNGVSSTDTTNWYQMLNFFNGSDLSDPENYRKAQKFLDVVAFADYLIEQVWNGNWDWPQNNWAAARERSDEGRWRFFIWDAEGAMFSSQINHVRFGELNSQGNPMSRLYQSLKKNEDFRRMFGDRVFKHFFNDGVLTAEHITSRYLEMRDQLKGVIPNMDMYPINGWVPQRRPIFLDACRQEGVFTFQGPYFRINGVKQAGGQVEAGSALTMVNPLSAGTIYYTLDGKDPRQPSYAETQTTVLFYGWADKFAWVPDHDIGEDWRSGLAFDDTGWQQITGAPGGIGYETGPGGDYLNRISFNVVDLMSGSGKNTSCYVRIPFTLTQNPDAFNVLTLKVRFDDGFVAWLNGVKVAWMNAPDTVQWNSAAAGSHEDGGWTSYNLTPYLASLKQGANLLALQGLNIGNTSSDFLINARLEIGIKTGGEGQIIPEAITYNGPIQLDKTTVVKACILDNDEVSALNSAIFAVGPVADNLRITELMYNPGSDPCAEYIELKNIGSETINLNQVRFTTGISFTFPDIDLPPDNYILVVRNKHAFAGAYPDFTGVIAGEYSGRLDNNGEKIILLDAAGRIIHDFRFKDSWYPVTDGQDFSLTIIDEAAEPGDWSLKSNWSACSVGGGTPGSGDEIIPPHAVVINELLAHSPAGEPDWIELFNTTAHLDINISGWYLSDSKSSLKKYRIPDNTWLGAGEYLVLYEDEHFGLPDDPCGFALSENGETIYLSSAVNGELTGYREQAKFDPSDTGVSLGRYCTSADTCDFVAMATTTPGTQNSLPLVGPVVISEVMYNPASGDQAEEYIELYNISSVAVTLYDEAAQEPWCFSKGIDFHFPTGQEAVTVAAGGRVIIAKDPAKMIARYGQPPEGVIVLGPYSGKLSNDGEALELAKPGDVDNQDRRQYIRVDSLDYNDKAPWPEEADGMGRSLTRIDCALYGNDPLNWHAAAPTPGY